MRLRVLCAQELGLGRWHAELLGTLARTLAERSAPDEVEIWTAVPDPVTAASALLGRTRLLAAPHHMPGASRRRAGPTRTFADILADAGWDDADTLHALITSWEDLLALVRPAVVIADHAPTLLLAARGRCPVVHVGLGFSQPPPTLTVFPSLLGPHVAVNESAIDGAVLAVLHEVLGARAPSTLPAGLSAERSFVTTLDALDPWRGLRNVAVLGPIEPLCAPLPSARGEKIVAYLSAEDTRTPRLLNALALHGRETLAYVRDASPALCATLGKAPIRIASRPLAMADALRDASVVIHHGGAGTIHQAVAAGRPQLLMPRYLEQTFNAQALSRRGVGALVPEHAADLSHALEALETPRTRATAVGWALTTAAEITQGEGAASIADAALALARG